jgi:acetyl esterase/lipase
LNKTKSTVAEKQDSTSEMADFSHYGYLAEEWTSYVRQHAPLPLPRYDSPEIMAASRRITNAARLNASRSMMEERSTENIQTQTVATPTNDFQEISARIYRPRESHPSSKAVLVYFHGGGFLTGTLGSEDSTCFQLAQACGIVVVSVNYRHTPEWTCPVPFQDVWDARNWILQNQGQHLLPSKIDLYVGGISSGACLAASVVIRERLV